ncbi:MAG: hypothetical protein Q8936_14120 [Bacillota bacterium]|nr:hypothetical protein [Bacillota bacterium]
MPRHKKPGHPPKFPTHKHKIIEAISKGASFTLACNYARVSYTKFREWIVKGEDEVAPEYVQFLEDIKEAEGIAAMRWLSKIDDAMDKEVWQAAAWKLERVHGKQYSSNAVVNELSEDIKNLSEQLSRGKDHGKANNES